MIKIAVLVSGKGSILSAFFSHKLPICLVIADRPCPAIEIAYKKGVETKVITRTFGSEFDREGFTKNLLSLLENRGIHLVVMAGFMTVFTHHIFDKFSGRILNVHPSLLPKFKGSQAVRDALLSGDRVTGCTIHLATSKLDEGPILFQQEVPILEGDTVETLHERIRCVERELYPKVVWAYLKRGSGDGS